MVQNINVPPWNLTWFEDQSMIFLEKPLRLAAALLLIKRHLNPIIRGWNHSNAISLLIKIHMFHWWWNIPTSPYQASLPPPPRYLPPLARPQWHPVVVVAAAVPVASLRWGYVLLPGSCRPVEVRNLAPNLTSCGRWLALVAEDEAFFWESMLKMKNNMKVRINMKLSAEQWQVYSWVCLGHANYEEEDRAPCWSWCWLLAFHA